ncbi:asparagine synthase-related protein [uncultured Methanolobus sp.]|uniref:asparagine synthetase B family protein n=1 Tax=uncultured Methanolobus sp. TaxID=218300 RepID=UPI0029C88E46|nr:asparagine synthase-related protein [uncultured Methanolobus sp.]
MSGICGLNKQNSKLLNKAIDSIIHRGHLVCKLDNDNYSLGYVGLEYRMQNEIYEDNNYLIFGDYSIYNILYLNSLLPQNSESNDKTESQIILELFINFGNDFVKYIEGIFVIAILIKGTNEILIFKDKFGVKPLYYYFDGSKFIFGSEIKSILEMEIDRVPNDQMIYDYFMFHTTDHTNQTFFEGIYNMPGGSVLQFKDKLLNIDMWYEIEDNIKYNNSNISTASYDYFKDCVFDSIVKSATNNAKNGCLLSGGLDSSSIITTALKNNLDMDAFSIEFDEYRNSKDITNIYTLVEEYDFILELSQLKPTDFINELDKYIYIQEQPSTLLGGYILFKAMELAKSHDIQVVHSGECADSIFSEGILFNSTYIRELLMALNLRDLFKFLSENKEYTKKQVLYNIGYQTAPPFIRTLVLKKVFLSGLNEKFINSCNTNYKSLKHDIKPNLNESLMQVVKHGLQYMIRTVEKSASFFSLDYRLPFVDEEIILSYRDLPSSEKMKYGGIKYPLKEIMKDTLIDSVRLDTKRGTILPIDRWFREIPEYREFMQSILNSDTFKSRKYFNHGLVQEMLNKHLNNEGNYGRQLYKIMMVESWLKLFIDEYNSRLVK